MCCPGAISRSAAPRRRRFRRRIRSSRSATTSTGSEHMTVFVDLSDVPVVDNHCHAIESQEYADVSAWRQLFTESPDPGMRVRDVVETAFYRRLIRAMAAFHDVAVTEDEVLQARARHRVEDLV